MGSWRKLGLFFIALGVFLLALFVFSDIAKQVEFGLLLAGLPLMGIGIFVLVTNPRPQPTPSPRFRILKGRKNEPQPEGPPGDSPKLPQSGGGPPPNGGKPPRGGSKPRKK
jgi:hypothetical protein